MRFSLFKNARSKVPDGVITLEQFMFAITDGQWRSQVYKVRSKLGSSAYKALKGNLPAVTMSGDFKSREEGIPISRRLKKHSELICLDVDKKDNPKMRTKDLVDKDCIAQFTSAGGEGIKIVYRCVATDDPAEHRRIYDAAVQRLEKKGIKLKVDPVVKSLGSLQYVSYDAEAYTNFKTKLVIHPLAPIKRKESKVTASTQEYLQQLDEYIDALGKKDVTKNYEDWLNLMFGLSHSLGEAGREPMHRICQNYSDYSQEECDEKYDSCLETKQLDNPVTIATVFQLLNSGLPKVKSKRLGKKYNKSHAVGVGEDTGSENADLVGMVRYKLFLFKKLIDKETNHIKELIPSKLNLNEFEILLRQLGFFRHEKLFVHINQNIVEVVDLPDILRIVTEHFTKEGDYKFSYRKEEYEFSWEEIVHKWREIRALSTTYNQISASVPHWTPDLLTDTATDSYIPYQNGVLHITKSAIKLLPYSSIKKQIWKERILPRDYTPNAKLGMFEQFFINVMGRGKTPKERTSSANFKRALWYYGYLLHCDNRQSTARAWILYDIKSGNNGRSGKTIIGTAAGKIRNVTVIDGKQIDMTNRFAFQTIQPWTDIVFIDDPSKYFSLVPLFNMITGQTSADRKGRDPIVKQLKWLLAANWILESEGASEAGRQFVSQLDDFYVRYSKDHGDTTTPLVDLHGKEFFTDWDAKDWAQFDNFSAKCISYHLKEKAPSNTIIGNSQMMRFIQLHEEELFYSLMIGLLENAKSTSDGGTIISQRALTDVVRENNESIKANRAGKIAREFLTCVGAKQVSISTIRLGGRIQMAYSFTTPIKNLSFGSFGEKSVKGYK